MTSRPEDILDRCLEAARSGGEPEAILREHPECADEVRPLLAIAADLGTLPAPAASTERVIADLARAIAQPAEAPRPRPRIWRRVASIVAVAMLALALAGWGTVSAAADSVPGDMLYPIKRLGERVRYALTVNAEGKAELHIVFADERLREAVQKHGQGGGIDPALLRRMLDHARLALEAGPDLPDRSRGAFVERVAWSCQAQRAALEQLGTQAGPEGRKALAPFLAACDSRCTCLREMKGCGPGCTCGTLSAEALRQRVSRLPDVPTEEGGHDDRE